MHGYNSRGSAQVLHNYYTIYLIFVKEDYEKEKE